MLVSYFVAKIKFVSFSGACSARGGLPPSAGSMLCMSGACLVYLVLPSCFVALRLPGLCSVSTSCRSNSISLLVLSLAIYNLYLLATCEYGKNLLRQNYSSIILLTLLSFCRVDYALYSILFFIYLCMIISKISNKKVRLQTLTNNICIAFMGLVIMLLLFYKMGELLLPVSGLIKQQFVSFSLESIIWTFFKTSHEVMYDINIIFLILSVR